jgi:hypothetical protein
MPAAVQEVAAIGVELGREHALPEGGEVVVALDRRLDELRRARVHGAALGLGGELQPAAAVEVEAILAGHRHLGPHPVARAQDGRERVAEVAAGDQRVGRRQVAGEVVAHRALIREVGALRVEVEGDVLPQRHQPGPFAEPLVALLDDLDECRHPGSLYVCRDQPPSLSSPVASERIVEARPDRAICSASDLRRALRTLASSGVGMTAGAAIGGGVTGSGPPIWVLAP